MDVGTSPEEAANIGGDEVVVVISDGQQNPDSDWENGGFDGIEGFPSESYSFAQYLQSGTPTTSSTTPVPILTEHETLRSRNNMPTNKKSSTSGIVKPSPIIPIKVPYESFVPRRRYLKPKSRLVEPPGPAISPYGRDSPSRVSPSGMIKASIPQGRKGGTLAAPSPKTSDPVTPQTPLMASPGGEDCYGDDDVGVTGNLEPYQEERHKKFEIVMWIELIVFTCTVVLLICGLTIKRLRKFEILGLGIWKWCVLDLVIFCGRLVTEWFITTLVFLIERNFLLKKKVLYFVYGLRGSVLVFIWLGLILLAWALLVDRGVHRSKNASKVLRLVTRGLASTLVGAGAWVLKTFLVKLLASSFHVNRYFDRIQQSIFHQYVLLTLSGPKSTGNGENISRSATSGKLSFRSPRSGKEGEKEEVINVDKLFKMKRARVSAWTMKGLIQVIRTSGLSTLSDALSRSESEDDGSEPKEKKITSEWEAKAAAETIFKNVAKKGHGYIKVDDLLCFMPKDEVVEVLPLFEGVLETGQIQKKAFCDWLVSAYKERKLLAYSLNDAKTAIEDLNKLVSWILLVILLIVWLLLMDIATTKVLFFFSSQLLLLVFMFGNTCKTVFEAVIFVFVVHPFDVGDHCVIDGVKVVVDEMNILTTIFLRYDEEKIHDNEKIYYPNAVLATKAISNFNRSPGTSDSLEHGA